MEFVQFQEKLDLFFFLLFVVNCSRNDEHATPACLLSIIVKDLWLIGFAFMVIHSNLMV